MPNGTYDIFIVGVGGQGVLTIAEIITDIAFRKDISANYFPTKGMAQRGGFVKAQLRLGHTAAGPSISMQSADLVVSMELSESLKAVPYLRAGGDFVLFSTRWEPTAVMLGKAPYPTEEQVKTAVTQAGGRAALLDESTLPQYQGKPVRPNIFMLGALLANTALKEIISEEDVAADLAARWPKAAEQNLFTLKAGMQAAVRRSAAEGQGA